MSQTFRWSLRDLVLLALVGAGIGVLWFAWTQVYELGKGPLQALHPALKYLLVGFWFSGGTIIPALLRKPGSSLAGELVAAGVQGLITQWGITSLIWGLVQGVGSELGFAVFGYRHWGLGPFILAGALAGFSSWILDFFYENYLQLTPDVWVIQIISIVISGILLAGVLGWAIGQALRKAKVID